MNVQIGNITAAVVQRVGNKCAGDGIAFSSDLCPMEQVESHLRKLIKTSFKYDDVKHFVSIDSIELNMVYHMVSKIFDDVQLIVPQANNLARHLYEQSIHPNVKMGEFYVVFFDGCDLDGQKVDAIGLFKSENIETIIKVQMEQNAIRVVPEHGMGLKKLDKGCLIFNIEKEDGYRVVVVDNTNGGNDAHYWIDNFLHVADCNDDYHDTLNLSKLCSGFVRTLQTSGNIVEGAVVARNAASLLSSGQELTMDNLSNALAQTPELAGKFADYKRQYEETNGVLPSVIQTNPVAAKKKSVGKMSTFTIGDNFEVKIKNPNAKVEMYKGEKRGDSYYKLYF